MANEQALATRDENANPIVAFRGQIETRANEFRAALPSHIKPEQFQRTILTAVQSDPELLTAQRQSLILACMKAAQDGLLPDKREAALVIFVENKKDGNQWVRTKKVQYLPMVYGLRKKILQSEKVTDITAKVVYRREVEEGFFVYEEGTEAMLRHKPMLDLSPEEATDDHIVAAYSMATFTDGTKSYEVMRRFEIDKVRETSQTGATRDKKGEPRTPKGPWVDWYPEQAKKTVMRRHSKTLPMSGDLLDVEARDDEMYARSTMGVLSSVEADTPALVPPTREEIAASEGADPATGEVQSDEDREREIAEQLDRETLGQGDGDVDDHQEDDDGLDDDLGAANSDPKKKLVDGLIEQLRGAKALPAVETEWLKHRAAMDDDVVADVEAEIAAAKKRVTPKPAAKREDA